MEGVFNIAHANNLPANVMSQMTNAMLKGREMEQQAREQQDGLDRQTAERQLQDTWGGDYQTNLNAMSGLLNQLPESVRDAFMNGRLANGQALLNSPEVAVFLTDIARKVNPSATVVPNSANPMQTINDEINALESKMGTPEWYKDTAAQQRYQQLIDARENMK